MRERAALGGLSVQLRESPAGLAPDVPLAFYLCRRSREERLKGERLMCLNRDGQWQVREGQAGSDRLQELEGLPAGVLAVVIEPDNTGLFWDESGEIADVDTICGLLKRWSGAGSV